MFERVTVGELVWLKLHFATGRSGLNDRAWRMARVSWVDELKLTARLIDGGDTHRMLLIYHRVGWRRVNLLDRLVMDV